MSDASRGTYWATDFQKPSMPLCVEKKGRQTENRALFIFLVLMVRTCISISNIAQNLTPLMGTTIIKDTSKWSYPFYRDIKHRSQPGARPLPPLIREMTFLAFNGWSTVVGLAGHLQLWPVSVELRLWGVQLACWHEKMQQHRRPSTAMVKKMHLHERTINHWRYFMEQTCQSPVNDKRNWLKQPHEPKQNNVGIGNGRMHFSNKQIWTTNTLLFYKIFIKILTKS